MHQNDHHEYEQAGRLDTPHAQLAYSVRSLVSTPTNTAPSCAVSILRTAGPRGVACAGRWCTRPTKPTSNSPLSTISPAGRPPSQRHTLRLPTRSLCKIARHTCSSWRMLAPSCPAPDAIVFTSTATSLPTPSTGGPSTSSQSRHRMGRVAWKPRRRTSSHAATGNAVSASPARRHVLLLVAAKMSHY